MDSTSVKIARHATERISTLESENFQLRLENVGLREHNQNLIAHNAQLRRTFVGVAICTSLIVLWTVYILLST